jgi:hypothetical protein
MAIGIKITPDNSFDPETLSLLSGAFENAWQRVQASGNQLARPGYANVMREVMAKHILNLAQHGERDEAELSDSAVRFFTTNYEAQARTTDPSPAARSLSCRLRPAILGSRRARERHERTQSRQ